MTRAARYLAVVLLAAASLAPSRADYPFASSRPSQLRYPALKFAPPDPVKKVLPNGMTLYLLEDHELPLFQAIVYINVGSIYEPADKVGLAGLTGMVMRTGGTETRTGDELNQTLESLAATVETSIGPEFGTARVSTLVKDADTGMGILADVLRHPAFRQEKLDLAKQQTIEAIRRRNDDPAALAERAFLEAVYGPTSPWARQSTTQSIAGITRDDLIAFHSRFFAPNNMILAASGDMSAEEMTRLIEKAFGDWARKPVEFPPVAPVKDTIEPGITLVAKEVDQSSVRMGHLGIRRQSPDRYAVRVMDYILGMGGFTSRLVQEVRTRQGLAYSVWGSVEEGRDLGVFEMGADTKVESTIPAITSMRRILTQMANEPVTAQEMSAAKEALLSSFVFRFQSRFQIASQRALLEMLGFPPDYLTKYQQRIADVTTADVQRVAHEYLHPDRMVTVVVGPDTLEKPLAALGTVKRVTPDQVP